MKLRPFQTRYQKGVIALIDKVLREYGDRVFLEGLDKDLTDIDLHYFDRGGAFVVLEDSGEIVGTHAVLPLLQKPGVAVFRRLYLSPTCRGTGLGSQLMQWALDWARENGFKRVEFWSDKRFHRAHSFFTRFQFRTTGEERKMNDSWAPYEEYFFYKDLSDSVSEGVSEGV